MFEQKFAFSLVVFSSHAAISYWFFTNFSVFFGSDFLNAFLNPFIVHSMPSFFCWNQIYISCQWCFSCSP